MSVPSERAPRKAARASRYDVGRVPADDRHEAWRAGPGAKIASTYRTTPQAPFTARGETYELGRLHLRFVGISGQTYRRTVEQARADGADDIVAILHHRGEAEGEADGRPFRQTAGELLLMDLSRPEAHRSTTTEASGVHIPRGLAAEAFERIDDLHGRVADARHCHVLARHLEALRHSLPHLPAASAERHARILVDLLAATVADMREDSDAAQGGRSSEGAALTRRARAAIDASIGSARLNVDALAATLGVSKSTLHRAFASLGGVETYIRERRLEATRVELARGAPVALAALAERVGFSDAAHLSRSFKARFGRTPSDYRKSILAAT